MIGQRATDLRAQMTTMHSNIGTPFGQRDLFLWQNTLHMIGKHWVLLLNTSEDSTSRRRLNFTHGGDVIVDGKPTRQEC